MYINLLYHNSEKGWLSWGSTEWSYRKLISSTVHITIILKVCLHVWKLLLYVFLIWLLIKFQYDSEKKQTLFQEKKKDGITFYFEWFLTMKKMLTKHLESYSHWERQEEAHCRKPDRMGKEKEGREGRGEGRGWTGMESVQISKLFSPRFPFKYSEIYILSTQKCLNCMFS